MSAGTPIHTAAPSAASFAHAMRSASVRGTIELDGLACRGLEAVLISAIAKRAA